MSARCRGHPSVGDRRAARTPIPIRSGVLPKDRVTLATRVFICGRCGDRTHDLLLVRHHDLSAVLTVIVWVHWTRNQGTEWRRRAAHVANGRAVRFERLCTLDPDSGQSRGRVPLEACIRPSRHGLAVSSFHVRLGLGQDECGAGVV